jgi:hypothetical protein
MGDVVTLYGLPGTAAELAALVRELAPELEPRPDVASESVLVDYDDWRLVLQHQEGWLYSVRPRLAFPYAHHGEVADKRHLAVLLGPILGLDPHTLDQADDPIGYLRHRALVTLGDPEAKAQEAKWEAEEAHRRAQHAIKVVDDDD